MMVRAAVLKTKDPIALIRDLELLDELGKVKEMSFQLIFASYIIYKVDLPEYDIM